MEINWLAVVVASLTSFVIGAVWFGPKTFYPVWMKAMGRKIPTERVEMSTGSTVLMFGGTYVGAFIQVSTLAVVVSLARTVDPTIGALGGAAIGALLGFGIGAAASFSHRQFAQHYRLARLAVQSLLLLHQSSPSPHPSSDRPACSPPPP